ncbi:MAG TPA: DinB family protein [Pyrinomonadaceae bacterium]|jgi:uncharacterized damage-inducible protein DinB|nr:DinB family protein [Pyrinomonadaceae bacterium]
MMNVKDARGLFAYNEWANALILDAAARLSDEEFTRGLGNSFPSVRDTLVHLLFAEWVWLRRWRGESPRVTLDPADFPSVERVRARLSEVARERAELVAGLSDADLDGVVAYVNAKGEEWRYPLGRMMRHVVNHSTYHRGQVVTMLRQLGAGAPSTDLLYYDDELAAGAS